MACSSVNYSCLSHPALLLRPPFHLACTTLLLPLSCLSITYSFVIVALELRCATQSTLLPRQLYLQMLIETSHWSDQGLWLLLHNQYWTLAKFLWYPTVTPSHGDLATMATQDQFLHTLWQIIDRVDVGVANKKVLAVGLGASWFG